MLAPHKRLKGHSAEWPFFEFTKRIWLPTLDTLRTFLLLPTTTEMLSVFQTMRDSWVAENQ
jgi:hypothetical protein